MMPAKFAFVGDDQYSAFINVELICMFRYKKDPDRSMTVPEEVEIDFMGGGRTKLYGETARHFVNAMSKCLV